jgi:Skp family chaperone for outer membrane proteins
MKKLILISLLTLGFISLSFAGGDDRDQELPLNSLNTVVDDASLLPESNQNKQASETNTADLEQLLKEIEKDLNDSTELDQKLQDKGYIEIFKENYIDSYSGRFILLGVFVLLLFFMLIFSMFFSRK